MAQGEVRCSCGKICGSPNALWTHIQGKALHGDPEHLEMYSEDGFEEEPGEVEEPEPEETEEVEESKGENLLDEYRENVEEEDDAMEVRELESEESTSDKPEYESIEEAKKRAPAKVEKILEAMQEKGNTEIEADADKNWLERDIR